MTTSYGDPTGSTEGNQWALVFASLCSRLLQSSGVKKSEGRPCGHRDLGMLLSSLLWKATRYDLVDLFYAPFSYTKQRDSGQVEHGEHGSGRPCPSLPFPLHYEKPIEYIPEAGPQGLFLSLSNSSS